MAQHVVGQLVDRPLQRGGGAALDARLRHCGGQRVVDDWGDFRRRRELPRGRLGVGERMERVALGVDEVRPVGRDQLLLERVVLRLDQVEACAGGRAVARHDGQQRQHRGRGERSAFGEVEHDLAMIAALDGVEDGGADDAQLVEAAQLAAQRDAIAFVADFKRHRDTIRRPRDVPKGGAKGRGGVSLRGC